MQNEKNTNLIKDLNYIYEKYTKDLGSLKNNLEFSEIKSNLLILKKTIKEAEIGGNFKLKKDTIDILKQFTEGKYDINEEGFLIKFKELTKKLNRRERKDIGRNVAETITNKTVKNIIEILSKYEKDTRLSASKFITETLIKKLRENKQNKTINEASFAQIVSVLNNDKFTNYKNEKYRKKLAEEFKNEFSNLLKQILNEDMSEYQNEKYKKEAYSILSAIVTYISARNSDIKTLKLLDKENLFGERENEKISNTRLIDAFKREIKEEKQRQTEGNKIEWNKIDEERYEIKEEVKKDTKASNKIEEKKINFLE